MLSQVVELIESKRRFMITSHVRPDGDSTGSSLALYWTLKALGKEADVIMRDPIPVHYRELPGAHEILVRPELTERYDAAFVIECSDIDRPALPGLEKQFVVNIDHHTTTASFGDINWIDATAAAVGEMIYNLCKALGVTVNQQIAECVYTALLTDTGSFHYSNTTERTFKIASELVRRGARPAHIARALYESQPYSKIKLLGRVLSTLRCDETGRLAWVSMTRDMMLESGATEDDLDGIVSHPMSIDGVEAVAFFKEMQPGHFRISLRSKGTVDVSKVAERFGGGGHKCASGCAFVGNLESAEDRVLASLQSAMGIVSAAAD
jgi:bifunctional oligoribonuclease and PAP phosphatase NrnA